MVKIKRWQEILFAVLVLIFVIIILLKFAELKEIFELIKQVNYFWLIIAVILQFCAFASLGALYKSIIGNNKISFFYFFKTAIAMLFVDNALPSFSASGNALLYYSARKKGVVRDKSSLLVGLNIFINLLFFFLIFLIGLIYLIVTKKFSGWVIILTSAIVLIFFILINRILWTKTGRRHFESLVLWLTKKFPKIKKRILGIFSDFYRAKKKFDKKKFFLLFFYVFLSYLFKILTIAAVFLSLGFLINPGILLVGYILAAVLSIASYIRIGVYEASMILGFSMMGIPYNLALTATLLYRAVAFWLIMLFGLVFFRILLRKNRKEK